MLPMIETASVCVRYIIMSTTTDRRHRTCVSSLIFLLFLSKGESCIKGASDE